MQTKFFFDRFYPASPDESSYLSRSILSVFLNVTLTIPGRENGSVIILYLPVLSICNIGLYKQEKNIYNFVAILKV
jgi:hypothetical protein